MTALRLRDGAVLCLGETMGMVAPTTSMPLVDAVDFRLEVGGAESNVAMRLAALGHRARWCSRLGRDALGDRVARAIGDAGVELLVERDDAHPTGLYLKDPGSAVRYYRAGSAASHATPALLDGVDWATTALLHTTGITAALSDGCLALVEHAVAEACAQGALVSFDVNHRPALWAAEVAAPVLLRIARSADLVLVGLDEAARLWSGVSHASDVRALLPDVGLLVVKDGAVGATAFAGDEVAFEPAPPVLVVEEVGAGDAFAAGLVAGLLRGDDLATALRLGHDCAATALSSTADV